MRITTRLRLLSSITLAALFFLTPVVVWSFIEFNRAKNDYLLADTIKVNFFERASFGDQYFLYREDRARMQWDKSKEMSDSLLHQARIQFHDEESLQTLERLRSNIKDSAAIFHRIVNNTALLKTAVGNRPVYEELDKRLYSQLLLEANAVRDAATMLKDTGARRVEQTYRRLILIIGLFAVTLAFTTILTSIQIVRLIRKRLAPLHDGAKIVADGDLDYRIPLDGTDEFSDLSLSINAMTDKLVAEITERKRFEQEKEQYFRFFLLSTNPMCIADPYGRFRQVNPAFSHLIGFSESELITRPFLEFVLPEDRRKTADEMKQQVETRTSLHFENRYVCKDGTVKLLSWTAYFDKNDGVSYATAHDITERKQAEQALAESESRFREIFNTISDAIFIHDATTGRIIDVNRRMCEMYGFTREEAIACGPDDLSAGAPPYSSAEAIEKICLAHAAGPQTFDWLARARDGHLFWTEVSLRFASIGSQQRILAVVRDITEHKRMEEELRRMNETLEQRVQEETAKNMAQERLLIQQSRLAAMGEMIGNIAHQWRQPLNALGLLISNIKDANDYHELDTAMIDEQAAIGRQLIEKMSTTIDDFRNFFKPNKEKQSFLASDGVAEAVKLVSHSFKNNNIEITVDKNAGNCCAQGYPNEFAQVVLNALSNAKEAIVGKKIAGKVRVTEEVTENSVIVSIRDNGGGIPEEIMGKVFDPYFTTKEKGTGIGLYMSKMIMEHMNGNIDIRNIEGGAEVRLTLPLAADSA
ncbi:MAG: PAS domain S-box protein [Sulfuricellaceae bacterium]